MAPDPQHRVKSRRAGRVTRARPTITLAASSYHSLPVSKSGLDASTAFDPVVRATLDARAIARGNAEAETWTMACHLTCQSFRSADACLPKNPRRSRGKVGRTAFAAHCEIDDHAYLLPSLGRVRRAVGKRHITQRTRSLTTWSQFASPGRVLGSRNPLVTKLHCANRPSPAALLPAKI